MSTNPLDRGTSNGGAFSRPASRLARCHWQAALFRGRLPPKRNTARARPTARSSSATSCPTADRRRPTSVIGKTETAFFRMINDGGGDQRPQDRIHFVRRRIQPAEDGRAGPQAGRGRRGSVDLQLAGHADQQRHSYLHEREEGAAAVRRHRRRQMGRPQPLSLDHGLAAQLSDRRPHLRAIYPEGDAGGQDRDPVPERRLRKGLRQRPQGWPWRQGEIHDRRRTELRDDRTDGRFRGGAAASHRRECLLQRRDPEIRGAGHHQSIRDRLEAAAHPQQRLGIDRRRAEARRISTTPRASCRPRI